MVNAQCTTEAGQCQMVVVACGGMRFWRASD